MRILHIAPYVSIDGAYGGPVTVALDQAQALADRGHHVTLLLGWDGRARVESDADVVMRRAFKPLARSFAGLLAPGVPLWTATHLRDFDVVHVHLTRDLVTLPAAAAVARSAVPLVLQTHGQVRGERSPLQGLLDLTLTHRVLRAADALLALTGPEASDLVALGAAPARVVRLPNGVPANDQRASFRPRPLVVFNSRLAPRKRPTVFVEVAELVSKMRPDVRFELWGPDGGEVAAVRSEIERRGLESNCHYRGAVSVEESRSNLLNAQVFLLPSRAEPFPMALLEAFSVGLPSVITDETGLSDLAGAAGAANVTDGSVDELAAAVLDLLATPGNWQRAADAARELADSTFSMSRIATKLEAVYLKVDQRSRTLA